MNIGIKVHLGYIHMCDHPHKRDNSLHTPNIHFLLPNYVRFYKMAEQQVIKSFD